MPLVTLKSGEEVLEVTLRFAVVELRELKKDNISLYQYLVARCRGNGEVNKSHEEEQIQRLDFVDRKTGNICASIKAIVLVAEKSGGFDDILEK